MKNNIFYIIGGTKATVNLLEIRILIEGLITHRFPLEQWRPAVLTAKEKRSGAIKWVLDFREARGRSGFY